MVSINSFFTDLCESYISRRQILMDDHNYEQSYYSFIPVRKKLNIPPFFIIAFSHISRVLLLRVTSLVSI